VRFFVLNILLRILRSFLALKNQLISRASGEFYGEKCVLIGKFCAEVQTFKLAEKSALSTFLMMIFKAVIGVQYLTGKLQFSAK
jgi:hypothetical protein